MKSPYKRPCHFMAASYHDRSHQWRVDKPKAGDIVWGSSGSPINGAPLTPWCGIITDAGTVSTSSSIPWTSPPYFSTKEGALLHGLGTIFMDSPDAHADASAFKGKLHRIQAPVDSSADSPSDDQHLELPE